MIKRKEIALIHIYAALAELGDQARRELMLKNAGAYSSKELDQRGFEIVMAALERVLWQRVDLRLVADPRDCKVCGRRMKPGGKGMGECPEGCETRKVYAWTRKYWQSKLPEPGGAHTRLVWKMRQLWDMLKDYLPTEEQNDKYLAGIIHKASGQAIVDIYQGGRIEWRYIKAASAHRTIEALKDRLKYSVGG